MIMESKDNIELMGTAGNGTEAVKLCREKRPDVAILDIRMPDMDGIETTKQILEDVSGCVIDNSDRVGSSGINGNSNNDGSLDNKVITAPLLLTTFDEPELIDRALDAGARGFILKNSPVEAIISAVETVARGGTVFAPDVIDYIKKNRKKTNSSDDNFFADLTEREKEIVELIASGLSNSEIADRLFLSNGTVRNYISLILEKTGLEHRTQIAVRYLGQ
jgi:DNA-binding NarL/FixJ family response regulator